MRSETSHRPEQDAEEARAWDDVTSHMNRYGKRGVQPRSLRSVLNRLLAKRGYNQQRSDEQIGEVWNQTVSEPLRHWCRVSGVKRGTLEVLVGNPAALQLLSFQKQVLLQELREKLPTSGIKSLKFKLG